MGVLATLYVSMYVYMYVCMYVYMVDDVNLDVALRQQNEEETHTPTV